MPRLTENQARASLFRHAIECVARDEDFRKEYIRQLEATILVATLMGIEDETTACRVLITFARVAPTMKARGEEEWKGFLERVWLRPEIREADCLALIALWGEGYDETEMLESVMERAERGDVKEDVLLHFGDEVKELRVIKERTARLRDAVKAGFPLR